MAIHRAVLAAAAVPLIALCWLEYRSLEELESRTHAAVTESLRSHLNSVRRELEGRLEAMGRRTLDQFTEADLRDCGAATAKIAAIGQTAGVDQVLVVSGCQCEGRDLAAVSGSCRRTDDAEVRAAIEGFREARPAGPFSYYQQAGQAETGASCSRCHLQGRTPVRHAGLYIYRVIPRPAGTAFAVIRIRNDYVMNQLLPDALSAVRRESREEAWRAWLAYDASPDAISTSSAALPRMTLAGEFEGATIHSLAREQVRWWMGLWILLVAALAAGAVFTLRAISREARLAELKSSFVANVSHEMKTPLAMIRALSETLEMGRVRDAAKMREYHGAIHKESVRLSRMIESVLELGARRVELEPEPVDPAALVNEAVQGYRDQIAAAGFELRVAIDNPLPAVMADPRAITGVLLNLLSNAVKYSRDRKRIDVRVRAAEGEVRIEVADQGIGIPRAEQERIFERFYRSDTSLVHETKGSGLGLTLARRAAEAHGGSLTVSSKPGQGSTFTLALPAEETGVAESAYC